MVGKVRIFRAGGYDPLRDRPRTEGQKRQTRAVKRLVALGALYRKRVPKKKRSQTVWAAFLRKHGPELLGKGK